MRPAISVSRSAKPAPDPAVARWIRRTLAADPPRASSLIVTVWGDAIAPHGGEAWLAGLIELLEPFGINERLTRTSVFRLSRGGWLAARSRGRESRYRLTREGGRRFEQAYRRIYAAPEDSWDGEWEVVVAPGDLPAGKRKALRDELSWEGFATFGTGVQVRPARGASVVATIAEALGLAGRLTVLRAHDTEAGATLAASAAVAWDLASRAAEYRRFLSAFGGVIDAFRLLGDASDARQSFVVRTLLIHAFRRVLLRDPQLPAALLPLDWPGAAAYALCRDFYRLTRRLAEAHLVATLSRPGERLPPANAAFYRRFGGLE